MRQTASPPRDRRPRLAVCLRPALVAVLLTPAAGLPAAEPPPIRLAEQGVARHAIVIAPDATASAAERFAADELALFLEEIVGAAFPVVREGEHAGPGIHVGHTRKAVEAGIDPQSHGEEDWVLLSVGEDLVLTGGRPRGTLYAVYEFLDAMPGCRWIAPDIQIVPPNPDLAVPALSVHGRPPRPRLLPDQRGARGAGRRPVAALHRGVPRRGGTAGRAAAPALCVLAFRPMRDWLFFRESVHPELEDAASIAEYLRGYFGPAAGPMRAYYDRPAALTEAGDRPYFETPASVIPWLSSDFYTQVNTWLDEAEALCQGEAHAKHLRHVQLERVPVDSGMLHLWHRHASSSAWKDRKEEVLRRYESNKRLRIRTWATTVHAWVNDGAGALDGELAALRREPPPRFAGRGA